MTIHLCALAALLPFIAMSAPRSAPAGVPTQEPSRPPASEKARHIEALVNRAAALVERDGRQAAFARFRTRGTEWFHDDTYLFAYDMQLTVLLNPAFPQREGTNLRGERDANGKAMHDEFVTVVKARGAGWVDYVFPKPGTTEPVKKWAYVKGVTLDGTPGIIGSGFYPE
jgi:cytochrome c